MTMTNENQAILAYGQWAIKSRQLDRARAKLDDATMKLTKPEFESYLTKTGGTGGLNKPASKGQHREMPDGTVWAAMPDYGVYVRFHVESMSDAWLLSMPMLEDNEPDARYYPSDVVQVDKDEVAATTPTFYAEALAMLGVE